MLEQIQRDLFALGARLADPAQKIAERVDQGRRRRRGYQQTRGLDRRARSGAAAAAAVHPRRRIAGRRRAARRAHRLPSRRARDRRRSAATRSNRSCSSTSTACRICCSSWRARPTTVRGRRKPSGERGRRSAGRGDTLTRAAYAYCERLAREHYENFPVASLLLPPSMRPHIAAIYAFARRADDFADEPGLDAAERLRLLDGWERRLDARLSAVRHRPRIGSATIAIFIALAHTIRTLPTCRVRCSRSPQRVPSGRRRPPATRPGPMCSITAAARPIRSAGWCCASPGYDDGRLDAAVGRGVHGAAADELLAGPRRSTGDAAGLYVPLEDA